MASDLAYFLHFPASNDDHVTTYFICVSHNYENKITLNPKLELSVAATKNDCALVPDKLTATIAVIFLKNKFK